MRGVGALLAEATQAGLAIVVQKLPEEYAPHGTPRTHDPSGLELQAVRPPALQTVDKPTT